MYKLKSLYCINFFLNIFQQYKFQMKKPVPKIYLTMNWSTNNRALINRGNIAIWFDPKTQWYAEPQGKQGRVKPTPT